MVFLEDCLIICVNEIYCIPFDLRPEVIRTRYVMSSLVAVALFNVYLSWGGCSWFWLTFHDNVAYIIIIVTDLMAHCLCWKNSLPGDMFISIISWVKENAYLGGKETILTYLK